ncbi:MAG: hypothetical protein OXI63_17805, partial [Candidatus Poribacteria bacterium]|nr:hypothetical protein [Candidatus Poribacteria bacterium]
MLDMAGGKMYWTDSGTEKIQRANLDGSNIEDIVTGVKDPNGIALDVAGGKMYWAGWDNIQRADLDGQNIEDLVEPYIDIIEEDVASGKVYWTVGFNGKIQRADLGQNIDDHVKSCIDNIIEEGLAGVYPLGIALDVAGGKMYWTEKWPNKIRRANLDGSNIEDIHIGEPLHGIALDVAGGKVYWTDRDDGMNRILRVNLDGSFVEELFTPRMLEAPHDIALDVAGDKMYWTAGGGGGREHKIQ